MNPQNGQREVMAGLFCNSMYPAKAEVGALSERVGSPFGCLPQGLGAAELWVIILPQAHLGRGSGGKGDKGSQPG